MRVCRSVSALVGLAVEAIEAVAFMFDFSDPADKLYGEAVAALGADGLADKEAQEEVSELRRELDFAIKLHGEPDLLQAEWHRRAGADGIPGQTGDYVDPAIRAVDAMEKALWPHGDLYDGQPDAESARAVRKPHLRQWCCGTPVPGPHAEGCTLTPRNGSLVSSAASGAAPTVSGSPVEARAAQPCPPTSVGQPAPLTPRELADAAYAVRGFALTSPVPDGWEALADRLTALAAE